MRIGNRQWALGKSKKLRLVLYALSVLLFALCVPVSGQQAKTVPRIGYVSSAVDPNCLRG
jgi:hypothetical protein